MASCDENYCFTLVDIGGHGSENDASSFDHPDISTAIEDNYLDIPSPEMVNGYSLPYVFVGDEIFPLKSWLIKPDPGKNLNESRQIFNYRLSRCRQTVENTFGIFAAKWHIFRRPSRAFPDTVEKIVMACVCLHNYLMRTGSAGYLPTGFVD